jgi:hypothetical protein
VRKPITLEINGDNLHVVDEEEHHLTSSDVESITETPELFIIQLKAGNAFLIPKDKLTPPDDLRNQLLLLSTTAKVPFKSDLSWKWK